MFNVKKITEWKTTKKTALEYVLSFLFPLVLGGGEGLLGNEYSS
jgi:hypothetical protein